MSEWYNARQSLLGRRLKSDRFFTDAYRPEIYTEAGSDWIPRNDMGSVIKRESHIPRDHSLRPIQEMVDEALKDLSADFDALYSLDGWTDDEGERLHSTLAVLCQEAG